MAFRRRRRRRRREVLETVGDALELGDVVTTVGSLVLAPFRLLRAVVSTFD